MLVFLSHRRCILLSVAALLLPCFVHAQEAPTMAPAPSLQPAVPQPEPPAPSPAMQPSPAASNYDKTLFLKPIPSAQLAFVAQYDGAPASDLYRDKQFRKLVHGALPDCIFHYGSDVPLLQAMDAALESSHVPIQVRENRYVLLAGRTPVYPGLQGHAFVWLDLQDGLVLGGFYFHPSNGEPTPALNIFSRQIKEDALGLSQLPPGFAPDLAKWSYDAGVPPITYRYFITGSNKKILLEHDEEFCLLPDGTRVPPESGCEQMAADAADLDMNAAYYLDQVHHATNATAWMIQGGDEVAFLDLRDQSCRLGPDPLRCRVHLTREHIHVLTRGPVARPVHR